MFFEFMTLLFGGAILGGKAIKEIVQNDASDNWLRSQGFNQDRQWECERMLFSANPEVINKIDSMLKRTVNLDDNLDCKLAVRQISIYEGWKYWDINEIETDPVALKAFGRKLPEYEKPYQYYGKECTGDEMAKRVIEETNHRKTWVLRCPHGPEMKKIFPMDYINEQKYQRAVAYEFSKSNKVKSKIDQYNRLRNTTVTEMEQFLEKVKLFDENLKCYYDSLKDQYWITEGNTLYGYKLASVENYQLYLMGTFISKGFTTWQEIGGIDYSWWRKR